MVLFGAAKCITPNLRPDLGPEAPPIFQSSEHQKDSKHLELPQLASHQKPEKKACKT